MGNIFKDDDGGLTEFWLSLFRNWLLKLHVYNQMGLIDDDRWTKEASDDAILLYDYLVKTQQTRVCWPWPPLLGVPVDQRASSLSLGRRHYLVSVFISSDNFLLYKGCIILTKVSLIS